MLKIKKLYNKNKEIILYLIFGGLTTCINIVTYTIFAKIFNVNLIVSNIIAWIVSIVFAYVVNKLFVFNSKEKTLRKILKELSSFIFARVLSLVLFDIAAFALMINIFGINDLITKLITQVLIIVFNYILSKFIIFKKK